LCVDGFGWVITWNESKKLRKGDINIGESWASSRE